MPVSIKELTVDVDCLNNKAIDVAVYMPNAKTFRGDLISGDGLEWRNVKTEWQGKHAKVSWDKFIDWMNS